MFYLPVAVEHPLMENFDVWFTLQTQTSSLHIHGTMSMLTTLTQCIALTGCKLSLDHQPDHISLKHTESFEYRHVLSDARMAGVRGLFTVNIKNATPHSLGYFEGADFPTVSLSREDGLRIEDLLKEGVHITVIEVKGAKNALGRHAPWKSNGGKADTRLDQAACTSCSAVTVQFQATVQSLLGCALLVAEGRHKRMELCRALKEYLLPLLDLDAGIPTLLLRCEEEAELYPSGKNIALLSFDVETLHLLADGFEKGSPISLTLSAEPSIVTGNGRVMVGAEITYRASDAITIDLNIQAHLLDSHRAKRSAVCKVIAFGVQETMQLEPGGRWNSCHLCDEQNQAFLDWLRKGMSLSVEVEWFRA